MKRKLYWIIGIIIVGILFSQNIVLASIPSPIPDAPCQTWVYVDSLGGGAKSQPIVQELNNRLIVAVQGFDDVVWVKEWNQTNLTEWYVVNNGSTTDSPKFVIENDNLWLYAKGMNGFILKTQYLNQGSWSSWKDTSIPNSDFGDSGPTVVDSYKIYTIDNIIQIGKCVNFTMQPEWAKNLIIYEIATKEFNSPNGTETGNFTSLKEKIPYLADLGITGIWLTGNNWADPHHFFNIWTQYATIRPDVIDPSLGTEEEFKEMIDEAHKYNIKVFLDITTHGVMNYSSLITEHPDWFSGSSWRMTDYDWSGDHPDLEKWWIDLWTRYVLEDGVDGFRLDLGHSRWDLWAKIKENVSEAGHPIVIMPESPTDSFGLDSSTYDFSQYDFGIVSNMNTSLFENKTRKFYTSLLSCHDSGWGQLPWPIENPYQVRGSMFKLGYGSMFTPLIPVFMSGEEFNNTYTEVPNKVGHGLYPGDNVTNWLYSSQLQWNELNNTNQKAIFDDFKKIISIRKNEPALNYFAPNLSQANVVVVDNWTPSTAPAPYIRWLNGTAIIIAGNPEMIPDPIPNEVCNGTWGNDFSFGGATPSQPVLESFNNRLIIAVRGMDNIVWVKEWNQTNLTEWYVLNQGTTLDSPKLVIDSGKLWIYVRGMDNFVYKSYYISQGNWSAWENTETQIFGLSGPTVTQTSNGTIYRVTGYSPIYLEKCSQGASGPINRTSAPQNITITMDIPLNKTRLEGKSFYNITDLWTNETWIVNETDLHNFTTTVSPDNFRIFKLEATNASPICTESWSCSSWSNCTSNIQTRTCTDSNNCGTTVNKPAGSQSCSSSNPSPGGSTSPSSSTPVKPGNKTVSTEPKIETPSTPALKQSDVVSLHLSCVDEIESGEPLSVNVTISSKNDINTTVELLNEKQDVSLQADETKALDFEVYAPETEGVYNLVAVTPYATGNKTINLIYKPLFLYVNPLENDTYEIHLKNFDNKSSTELEVIKDNSETVYLDEMNGKIDYRVNLTFSNPGSYTIRAKATEVSGLVDEDTRTVKIEGTQEINYGYIILGVAVVAILIATIIIFKKR